MIYKGDYGVLESKNKAFFILSVFKLKDYINNIEEIENVYYGNKKIILKTKNTSIDLLIENEDDLLLFKSDIDKNLTILNEKLEAVKIFNIKEF